MKWIKLLWSVVVLGIIALGIARLNASSTGIISAGFFYLAIFWVLCLIITPIVILCRIFRIIRQPNSFGYILIGTANFATGLTGLYMAYASTAEAVLQSILLLDLNILMGIFVLFDTFIRPIPGYRKKSTTNK